MKLISIPKILKVDIVAVNVGYSGKKLYPHTQRGCLSFSIPKAQKCKQQISRMKLITIPKILKVDIVSLSVRYSGKNYHPHI